MGGPAPARPGIVPGCPTGRNDPLARFRTGAFSLLFVTCGVQAQDFGAAWSQDRPKERVRLCGQHAFFSDRRGHARGNTSTVTRRGHRGQGIAHRKSKRSGEPDLVVARRPSVKQRSSTRGELRRVGRLVRSSSSHRVTSTRRTGQGPRDRSRDAAVLRCNARRTLRARVRDDARF